MPTPLNPFDKRPAPDGADAGGASAKRARVSDAVAVEAGASAPPPVGDAPSEHAEMFKLIHRFATQGVRTEGLTLRACMRDSGWSHLPRPFIKRVQVHNKWGYAVGVEHGSSGLGSVASGPALATPAAVYFDRDYAVEQFCSLFHEHTPNTAHFFPTGQSAQERARIEGRACWDLSWRECKSAGIVASCSGTKARSDEGNNRKVKRALDNEPVLITLCKNGKHTPRATVPWDVKEALWDVSDGEQEEDLFGDDD